MTELAWAAGLFEGEGCVVARPVRRRKDGQILRAPMVRLAMCNEVPVRRIAALFDLGVVKRVKPGKEHWNEQYAWVVTSWQGALQIYDALAPWLSPVRLEQFQRVFDTCASTTTEHGSRNGSAGSTAWVSR